MCICACVLTFGEDRTKGWSAISVSSSTCAIYMLTSRLILFYAAAAACTVHVGFRTGQRRKRMARVGTRPADSERIDFKRLNWLSSRKSRRLDRRKRESRDTRVYSIHAQRQKYRETDKIRARGHTTVYKYIICAYYITRNWIRIRCCSRGVRCGGG